MDDLGKQISSNHYDALNAIDMNIGSLTSGIYVMKITSTQGGILTAKIIKQ